MKGGVRSWQCLQQIKTAHFKVKVKKRVPTACCDHHLYVREAKNT